MYIDLMRLIFSEFSHFSVTTRAVICHSCQRKKRIEIEEINNNKRRPEQIKWNNINQVGSPDGDWL
jgi:hypothetical protein